MRLRSRSTPATAVALAAAVSLSACATIIHGKRQDLGISSSPTNAVVTIDSTVRGNTPLIASLVRRRNHIIRIQLEGYQPFDATVTKKVSGWVWGNIVFGGIIGLAVDAGTGGLYALTPEQVTGQLLRQGASRMPAHDGVYVVLVPRTDSNWSRLGRMTQLPIAP